ncbi:hypothetical protein KIPB_000806, partial [Kipferlia bialata]
LIIEGCFEAVCLLVLIVSEVLVCLKRVNHMSLFGSRLTLEGSIMSDISKLRSIMFYGVPVLLGLCLCVDVRDGATPQMEADVNSVGFMVQRMWFIGVTICRIFVPVLELSLLVAAIHCVMYAILFSGFVNHAVWRKVSSINMRVFLVEMLSLGLFSAILLGYLAIRLSGLPSESYTRDWVYEVMAIQESLIKVTYQWPSVFRIIMLSYCCLPCVQYAILIGILVVKGHKYREGPGKHRPRSPISPRILVLASSSLLFALSTLGDYLTIYVIDSSLTLYVAIFCYDLAFLAMMVCFMPVRAKTQDTGTRVRSGSTVMREVAAV